LAIKEFSVRVGEEEIGRILNLKENLNQNELLLSYAPRYQNLGWVLVGMKVPDGTPLDLDLSQPAELWSQQLSESDADLVKMNLGIRTGKASGLLVLEVTKGEGVLSLDQLGEWRADCVAEMGGCREQHYYVLPPEEKSPPSNFLAPQVMIYGEGGMVLVPPSMEPQAREPWRWVSPPWETPPQPPKPAVWQFLKEHVPAGTVEPEVPSWGAIYQVIAKHSTLLKALLVPTKSQDAYYQGILRSALQSGFQEPAFLLGLLWHAPHGEARHNPDKQEYFQKLIDAAQAQTDAAVQVPALPATLDDKSWPDVADPPAGMEALELFADSGLGGPGRREPGEAPAQRFDKSISGQFFQLLAGLGEKVIMESCRYEAMLAGLKSKAGDIDGLVSHWEQQFGGEASEGSESDPKALTSTVEFDWDSMINVSAYKRQQALEIQAAASDFLAQNPDLAGDRHKVQMVIFCLKNYISINPEYAGLPFREKLDRAGIMARGFFRARGTV
jgi:hypothetical protein